MSSPFPFIERTKSLVEFIDSSSACRSVIASLRSLANEEEMKAVLDSAPHLIPGRKSESDAERALYGYVILREIATSGRARQLMSSLGKGLYVDHRRPEQVGPAIFQDLVVPLRDYLEEQSPAEAHDAQRSVSRQPVVFISCGQRTPEERALGRKIRELVERLTPFRAYFAQDQTSVEGLTNNIFGTLHNATGFIAVLHRRGYVAYERNGQTRGIRASVFVEQEIALASFMQQVLDRPLQAAAFIESGIDREGVREHIILNPIEFSSDEEILAHLRRILPTWTVPGTPETPMSPLKLDLKIERRASYVAALARSEDKLVVLVENESGEPIREYWGEVAIPKGVVENPSSSAFSWIRERSDGDVDVFRFTQEGRRGKPIYPHDKVEAWSTMFPSDAPRPGQEATVTLNLKGHETVSQKVQLRG